MDEEIDRAIRNTLGMIRPNIQPEASMKYTQSALNLAHVKSVLAGIDEEAKPKRGRPPKVAADEA